MYGYSEYFQLTPSQVLQKVSQEQIFEFVLQKPIYLNKKIYTSPFRVDTDPGCRIVSYNGKLWFEDYASGIKPRDCFNMIEDMYGVTQREAVQIICSHFSISSDSSDYTKTPTSCPFILPPKVRSSLMPSTREWARKDKMFWSKFLITLEQVQQDEVKVLRSYSLTGVDGKVNHFTPYDITYLFEFGNHYKIYRPFNPNPEYRFITNCDQNDIGNLSRISIFGNELTIAKSYKDHRVVRNVMEIDDVIWFPNETMIPGEDILADLCVRFPKINILFDNDRQGMEGSEKLVQAFKKVKEDVIINKVFLPKNSIYSHKDPGEFVNKEGSKDLKRVLKELGIKDGTGTRKAPPDCPFFMD